MHPRRVARVTALALTCAGVAACSGGAPAEREPAAPPPASIGSPASPPGSDAAPPVPMALVHHATLPQLDVPRAVARRIEGGRLERYRGLRVRADLAPAAALRAVERDPGVLAVVPLRRVGPTVVAARVGGVDPLRSDPDTVSMTVVGDVMLTRGVADPEAALAPMRQRLAGADLTVGNLESTLSTAGAPTQGTDSFGASPALVPMLREAGFDALSLANNHAGDYGEQALLDTVDTLRRSPIEAFGAGADLAAAARPAVVRRAGTSFAFVGFNAIGETPRAEPGVPGALSVRMPPRTGPLVPADLGRVLASVRTAARDHDAVVVLPHWGTQYTHRPEPVQRDVARQLVEAGADLVVGGHPHWVQGLDAVDGVPTLHSLGNFVFDMDFSPQTLEGVVLESTWTDGELRAIRLVPYRMDTEVFAPRVLTGAAGAGILDDVRSTSTGPFAG